MQEGGHARCTLGLTPAESLPYSSDHYEPFWAACRISICRSISTFFWTRTRTSELLFTRRATAPRCPQTQA